MLQALWHPSGYISSISDVEGLDAQQAQRVQAQFAVAVIEAAAGKHMPAISSRLSAGRRQ
jgi:hypothetical protein